MKDQKEYELSIIQMLKESSEKNLSEIDLVNWYFNLPIHKDILNTLDELRNSGIIEPGNMFDPIKFKNKIS